MMRASVDKWAQSLREEFDVRVQGTQINMQVTKTLIEATWQEFITAGRSESLSGV
jgi:hypothetical protein